MRYTKLRISPERTFIAASLLVAMAVASAYADEWKEIPYNPAVGSHWIVQTETNETRDRPNGPETLQIKSRGELTIEAKTATGFLVSYVAREYSIEGNAASVQIMRPVLPLLKDIVIRAETDAAGRPIDVKNLDEARTAMRSFVDQTLKPFENNPKLAQALKSMFDGMVNAEGPNAGKTFMHEVLALAVGQNTGLKLGEKRQETNETPNPLGGPPIKMTATFRIADASAGKVTYSRDSETDPEAMKDFAVAMMQKLGVAADKPPPPQIVEMIKGMAAKITEHDDIEVEGGMTRSLREEQNLVLTAMGRTLSKKSVETMTLTPAP